MKKVKNKKQTGRVVQRSKKNKKSNSSKKINEMLRLGVDDGYTSHECLVSYVYGSKQKVETKFYHIPSLKDPKDDYLKHQEYLKNREQLKNKQLHILRVQNEKLAA